ncbi:hypothetical protein F4861DRAFT_380846 [Xylaria intraflava]|nr:hypothetical protein F4861DRAFT_380846 [Xylaria intraflava]
MAAPSITAQQYDNLLAHQNETLVPAIIGITILNSFLSIFFAALRLRARRLAFGKLQLDISDWLVMLGVALSIAFNISLEVSTRFGLGRHLPAVSSVRLLSIAELVSNTLHPLAITSLKLSILALYRSIFPTRTFQHVLYLVTASVCIWCVVTVILGVLLCIPVEALWDSSITPRYCISLNTLGLATTTINILTDFVILVMPIPPVLKLQTTAQRKRLIILTFAVGTSVCGARIARIPFWIQPDSPDVGWAKITSALLASTELAIGVLAASVPTYRPLVRCFKRDRRLVTCFKGDQAHSKTGYYLELGGTSRPQQHYTSVSARGDLPVRQSPGILVTEEVTIELKRDVDQSRVGSQIESPTGGAYGSYSQATSGHAI